MEGSRAGGGSGARTSNRVLRSRALQARGQVNGSAVIRRCASR